MNGLAELTVALLGVASTLGSILLGYGIRGVYRYLIGSAHVVLVQNCDGTFRAKVRNGLMLYRHVSNFDLLPSNVENATRFTKVENAREAASNLLARLGCVKSRPIVYHYVS